MTRRTKMKVQAYISAAGIEVRPKTGSFRAWRDLAAKENTPLKLPPDDPCPFCEGWLSAKTLEGYGEVWCVCQVLRFGEQYRLAHSQFASPMQKRSLDDLHPWDNPKFQKVYSNMLKGMSEWLEWPETWITFMGSVGIGKTHILQSLAQELVPWSLYITASDFESKLFLGMGKESDYKVETLIRVVSYAPFLFLDDLGTEYGSKFPKAALRRVIDYRYSKPSEYVTVVASNLTADELMRYDERVADRLLDKHIGGMIDLRTTRSWRRYGKDIT
jgi:DNA replication protein DnaC